MRRAILIFTVLIVIAVAGFFGLREHNFQKLSNLFDERLRAGDYLAAVAAAGKLKEDGANIGELDQKISSAARLLIAEDSFNKAKQAVGEKRFSDASAILRGSEAITDPTFKYYEEAMKLYDDAEALAAGVAHKTAATINSLENQATLEKNRRTVAEQQSEKLSGNLKDKEAKLAETARKLELSKQEADIKQAALVAEQARATALLVEIGEKTKQKFISELKTYNDLAVKGKEQLDNVLVEILAKRDVTALVYLSQGKILFEEAKSKVEDLRNNRTPSQYKVQVDDLKGSLVQLLDASKQLRNAVVYIEDQGSTDFTNNLNGGKVLFQNGSNALKVVTEFISANS